MKKSEKRGSKSIIQTPVSQEIKLDIMEESKNKESLTTKEQDDEFK